MIILRSKELKTRVVRELGLDNIRKASPQNAHHHKNTQLTFMMQGALSWRFPDGKTLRLRGGEYCVTQPGDKFEVRHDVLSPCLLMWTIIDPFRPDADKDGLLSRAGLAEMGKILADAGNAVRKISGPMSFYLGEIRKTLQQRETKPSDVLDADKTRLCLAGILLESVRDLSDSVRSPARQEASLGEQVEKLTLADPAENFTVGEMADSIGLNPGVFGKKFRKETGMSPADFVRRVKLEESVRLMREESRNVTETAYSLGFSSSQYFATIFKKYFGRTPKEFRKRG